MRVLLADDSGLILERLQEMLTVFEQVEIAGALGNGTKTLTLPKYHISQKKYLQSPY